jgi:hypothetical protein
MPGDRIRIRLAGGLEFDFVYAKNGRKHAQNHSAYTQGCKDNDRWLQQNHEPLNPPLQLALEIVTQSQKTITQIALFLGNAKHGPHTTGKRLMSPEEIAH